MSGESADHRLDGKDDAEGGELSGVIKNGAEMAPLNDVLMVTDLSAESG